MFDPVFALLSLAAVILPIWAFVFWLNPQNRQFRGRKGFVLLGCALASVAGFLWYQGPVLFVSNEGILNTYVLVPPSKASVFNDELGGVIEKYGFSRHPGKTPFGYGLTYYVMNGVGNSLWLWSTNMPMSGQEDVSICGHYPGAHPDPGQFGLSISRMWPFGTRAGQREYLQKISADLKVAGYEIRAQPVLCSPASKALAPH